MSTRFINTVKDYSTFTLSTVLAKGAIAPFENVCTGHVGTNTIIGDGVKAVNALPFQEPVYIEIAADTDLSSFGLEINGNRLEIYNTDTSSHTLTLDTGVVYTIPASGVESISYNGSWRTPTKLIPGMTFHAAWNDDPANLGIKALQMTGQGLLRADYTSLDNFIYCGDANNATYTSFYHADDAAGTTRNTTGAYLILPDARGRYFRSLDLTGSVDPDGASRYQGSSKEDRMQRTTGDTFNASNSASRTSGNPDGEGNGVFEYADSVQNISDISGASFWTTKLTFDSAESTSPNPAKTNDFETSVKDLAFNGYIAY